MLKQTLSLSHITYYIKRIILFYTLPQTTQKVNKKIYI